MDEADRQRFEAAVAAEVARRLAERARRRRPWLAVGGALLLVLAGAGVWLGWRAWSHLGRDLDRRQAEFEAVNRAYQAELARNQDWQRQRAAAERATGFQGGRSQVEHEAAELNRLFGLVARASAHSRAVEGGTASGAASAEQLAEWADQTDALVQESLGILGRVVLRGTDPGERAGRPAATAAAPRP
jgi:hypothetical protein